MCPRLEAEIEEAHLKAKEEMMQGIQMAKEMAQKELSDQKAQYEDRIRALERELVHTTFNSCFFNETLYLTFVLYWWCVDILYFFSCTAITGIRSQFA